MTDDVPRLETSRLLLRGHRLEDFDACFAIWSDPVTTRHIGGKPSNEQQCWQRLLTYVGHWRLLGFGYWALEEKATGRYLGEAGFAEFKRAVEPPIRGVPECGWVIAPHAHGKGFATEAVSAVVAWGDARFGAGSRTVCMIDPGNLASLRVAEKCGYREFARALLGGEPTILHERK